MTRALAAALLLAAGACSTAEQLPPPRARPGAAASRNERRDRDRALGERVDRRVRRSTDLYDDPDLAAYVRGVGARVAAKARCEGCRFTFRVLDDADPNAFAVPGGFVYVTRGILALLGSEAELAAILGHEIGHVTARHAIEQWSRAKDPLADIDRAHILDETGHSRDDEREADRLGVEYAARAGYDAEAMASALAALAASEPDQTTTPMDDHPDTRARVARAALVARVWPRGIRARARYLRAIDGIVVGDDPRRGYVAGDTFVRPDAGFHLTLPGTWRAQVESGVLLARTPDGQGGMLLARTGFASLAEARTALFEGDGVRHDELVPGGRGAISTLSAPVFGDDGDVTGTITLFEAGRRVFLSVSTVGGDPLASLAPGDGGRQRVEPLRLHLQRLAHAARARDLEDADALARFCRLNHVAPAETIPAGRWIKRVGAGSAADDAAPHLQ